MKVLYTRGEKYIHTSLTEDLKCLYSGMDLATLKQEYPNGEIMDLDQACDMIEEALATTYSKPWIEISKEDWWDALECLPPLRWQKIQGVEFFQMSEMMHSHYTAHYARINGKYYTAVRSIHQGYIFLANQINEQIGA